MKINKNVDDFVASLGNIDDVSPTKFYQYLLKLCTMFKNAHLFVRYKKEYENRKFLNPSLFLFNNKVYTLCDRKFFEIEKIGGKKVKKICQSMSEYICYETNEWLSIQLNKFLNMNTLYNILGIDHSFVELKNGQRLKISTKDDFFDTSNYLPPYDTPHDTQYSYLIIKPNIIKINYRTCNINLKNDIDKMFEEIKDKIEKENLTNYILDVRGNTGGDSEIIVPFLEYLHNKNITGVTLTDNLVFSSGTFAVRYAKEILNTTTIGQALGQGNIRFG